MAKRKPKHLKTGTKKAGTGNQFGVLLERMDDKITLLAEGQTAFREEVKVEFGKVWDKFDSIDGRVGSIDSRLYSIDGRLDSLEQEMRSNFKTVFEYLSRIDGEIAEIKMMLENKADKQELAAIERRVARLEAELAECKKIIAAAKKS